MSLESGVWSPEFGKSPIDEIIRGHTKRTRDSRLATPDSRLFLLLDFGFGVFLFEPADFFSDFSIAHIDSVYF